MSTLEADPVVLRTVFPAEVTTPDGGFYRSALVKVTREGVYVWHGERQLAYEAARDTTVELGPVPRIHADPLRVATIDGDVIINRAAGCGCASPLKSFRPFGVEKVATA